MFRISLGVALLLALAWGCDNGYDSEGGGKADSPAQKVKEEAGDLVEALGDWAKKTKDDVVAGIGRHQDALEKRVEGLRKRAAEKGEKAEQKWKDDIEPALKARLEDAKNKLEELRRSGDEAWKGMRAGVKKSFESLEKAVEDAKQRLEE